MRPGKADNADASAAGRSGDGGDGLVGDRFPLGDLWMGLYWIHGRNPTSEKIRTWGTRPVCPGSYFTEKLTAAAAGEGRASAGQLARVVSLGMGDHETLQS